MLRFSCSADLMYGVLQIWPELLFNNVFPLLISVPFLMLCGLPFFLLFLFLLPLRWLRACLYF